MVRVVLALLLSVIVAGCATLGVRTEGESGPLAWHLTDLKFIGTPGESTAYSYTLVLREREGRTVTFTHRSDIIYPPGGGETLSQSTTEYDISLVLQPHQEWRLPYILTVTCADPPECVSTGVGFAWTSIFTGTSAEGKPVKAVIRMQLPENPDTYQTQHAAPSSSGTDVARDIVIITYQDCLGRRPETEDLINVEKDNLVKTGISKMREVLCFSNEGKRKGCSIVDSRCVLSP